VLVVCTFIVRNEHQLLKERGCLNYSCNFERKIYYFKATHSLLKFVICCSRSLIFRQMLVHWSSLKRLSTRWRLGSSSTRTRPTVSRYAQSQPNFSSVLKSFFFDPQIVELLPAKGNNIKKNDERKDMNGSKLYQQQSYPQMPQKGQQKRGNQVWLRNRESGLCFDWI